MSSQLKPRARSVPVEREFDNIDKFFDTADFCADEVRGICVFSDLTNLPQINSCS